MRTRSFKHWSRHIGWHFGFGIVTWEYRVGTRSGVLPGLLAGIMRATSWIGPGSVGYLTGVQMFLCVLSLTAVLFAFLWAYRIRGLPAAIFSSVVAASWYELIYYAPKAFFEVVAAHLLLPGLYFAIPGKHFNPRKRLFIAGLFYGCAVALRINLAPAVAVAAVYTCRRDWRERWMPMVIGISLPVLAAGLLDAFTWSFPFQSTVSNLWVNVGQNKATQYGTLMWHAYIWWLIKRLGPMLLLAMIGARRSPFLGWVALAVILPHSLIPHKEYRFIYPVIPLIMPLVGMGIDDLVQLVRKRYSSPKWAMATGVILVAASLSTSAILGQRYPWKQFAGTLRAMRELSQAEDVCGLGLWQLSWPRTAVGYAYLHRKVPIFEKLELNEVVRKEPGFNYILSVTALPAELSGYPRWKCWQEACLYRRPGLCVEVPDNDINEVLRKEGR